DNNTTQFGLGKTLSRLKNPNPMADSHDEKPNGSVDDRSDGNEWTIVGKNGRPTKKQKSLDRDTGNYPAITHSPHARLQNYVRIGDLQSLALYILADGSAPQWVSLRHHTAVRQVVVLMVPGLEAGMFN